jgi:glycosyltransferase involved in cell wall biosynthesis
VNILIVTQYFWPEEFRINDLSLGLLEKGHRVTVYTGIPNYPTGRFFRGYSFFKNLTQNFHGVKILRVPLVPRGNGRGLRLAINYFSFALFGSIMGAVRCREEYDLIFVYEPSPITVGLPAIVMKKIKKAPIMFWVQDLWPESVAAAGAVRSQRVLKLIERLVSFIYNKCDRILVTSLAYFPPIKCVVKKPERILYFPQTSEELYRPVRLNPEAPELGRMPAGFTVMFAGNIGAAQDFETILSAAENLTVHQDIKWIILGDGRMRPWVEDQIRQRALGKTIYLLGRYPVEAMPRFFSLADILLVTLKREPIFALTIPAKVQSYLACGKPIVAALDGEGARIIAEAGAGLACPAENPAALAEAILTIYRMSAAERQEMGMRGRAYYEKHFDRSMLLDRLNNWMRELYREAKSSVA